MKEEQPDPLASFSNPAMQERILRAVESHGRKSGWIAGIALFLGLVSVAASIAIVSFYFVFYRPKEKQLLRDLPPVIYNATTNATAGAAQEPVPRPHFDPVRAHLFMITAIGVGTALVAGSVGLLGLGTLLLVSLVLINRRVALRQISASLADISLQLKQLQRPTEPP
jgi:hypothetical protein